MKGEIKVSVIMLTYNHEKYIRQALESVLAQKTDFSYEILIGDDASADGTLGIVQEFKRHFSCAIHIFIRSYNMGATANLALLLKQARGQYIASCEGDDYWTDPQKLQKQVDFLESHSEYIGCTHDITLVNQDGISSSKQSLAWVKDKPVFRFSDFKGIYLPGHPVSMVYRNIYAADPAVIDLIETTHPQIADRTIAMLLALNGDIVRLNEDMACYRQAVGEGNSNLTAREFTSNIYGKLTDMEITNRLETYLRDEKQLPVSFNRFRRRLLVRTLAKAICFGSADSFDCFGKMLKEWHRFRKNRKRKGVVFIENRRTNRRIF